MTIVFEERQSDSPYIEKITQGWTLGEGSVVRPAEVHWHMVFTRLQGQAYTFVVGPLTTAGIASWGEGAEVLWIQFKLGTFIPYFPTPKLLDMQTSLPLAASNSFWLKGSAWQFPDYNNTETFVNRLVRQDLLLCDPVVNAALQDQHAEIPSRTVRHRFLRTTGLTQNHIRQFERAKYAADLLQQGVSILDTVHEAGYFDQAHLTKSLKRFIGKTPAQQYVHACEPE